MSRRTMLLSPGVVEQLAKVVDVSGRPAPGIVIPETKPDPMDRSASAAKRNSWAKIEDVERICLEAIAGAISELNPVIGEAIVAELDRRERKRRDAAWHRQLRMIVTGWVRRVRKALPARIRGEPNAGPARS